MLKDCEHKKWCKNYFIDQIPIEKIEELYRFLQGELPFDIHMKRPPHLSEQMAFRIIWFLQEQTGVLPGNIERCITCGRLYDSKKEGSNDLHCDWCRRD